MIKIVRQLTRTRFRIGSVPALTTTLALISAVAVIGVFLFVIGPRDTAEADLDLTLLAKAYSQSTINSQAMLGGSPRVIPAAAFVDDGFGNQSYGMIYSGGYMHPYPSGTSFCAQAPVYLPDGARVKSLTNYMFDNDASHDIYGPSLGRVSIKSPGNGSQEMAYAPTSSASTSIQIKVDNTINNPIVDNSSYYYFLYLCTGAPASFSNLRFIAAAVDFVHRAQLPVVVNCPSRESEPNEDRDQADRFCIDQPIRGNTSSPSSVELDWFRFEWNGQGTVQVDLHNFVPTNLGQLILYKGTTELTKDFTADAGNHYQVSYSGAAGAGTYYILVTTEQKSSNDYILTATIK